MATIGNSNLKLVNGKPEVEKLQNGRHRLTFFCNNDQKNTDWYEDNLYRILPAFGTPINQKFGDGEWSSVSEWTDEVFIDGGLEYIPAAGVHYVKLVYETVTGTWTQTEQDREQVDKNGLTVVTRPSVALVGTVYDSVVGVTSITYTNAALEDKTLYLSSKDIKKLDSHWELEEVWLEAGTINVSTSGAGDGLVNYSATYLVEEPSVPAGYIVTARSTGDYEGLKTIQVDYKILPDDGAGGFSYTYTTTDQFTVPGIVDYDTFDDAINTKNYILDVTPQIPTSIDISVKVEYTSDGTSAVGTYYQPNYWTKVTISGSTLGNSAFAKTSTYINHIAGSTGKTVDTTTTPEIDAMQGYRLYENTTGRIKIVGPSADIAGTAVVLSITRDEVFTGVDGVNYYKLTTVTGTIPARP